MRPSRTKEKAESQQTLITYQECPAKTYAAPDGKIYLGRSVYNHCQIVGLVAAELIKRSPQAIREVLYRDGDELVAAAHDIGKVSPTFYEKIRRACSAGHEHLPILSGVNPDIEIKEWGGHAGVSQATTKGMQVPKFIPEILGQHHGFSPPIAGKRPTDDIFGGEVWNQQRGLLVDELKQFLQVDWPEIGSSSRARVLAGLTSVADWIGSGRHFENPSDTWESLITQAVDESGFLPVQVNVGLSFEQVFGFSPRPAQVQLIESAKAPGVYVLEAPMGLGKTEAALYVAYQMLAQGQASGIYFALPTQLTSNKIYERFNEFLSSVLADECPHRRSLLLHGKAWLLETQMGEEGQPGGAWFNQAKRGLLAPFAVGTIDQALMAAINVKHGFVRAFGLAGKVVILDEVHSYDAYTGTLLQGLVTLLRELHCTVIILSATLQQARRSELIGRAVDSFDYPLVTAVPVEGMAQELAISRPASVNVMLRHCHDTDRAMLEALDRASTGQQVLWIENTVGDAQTRYLDLAARAHSAGVECGLLHSRYTQTDRTRLESQWVATFGKQGWSKRLKRGRILIGTQVLEQSLDIDADFLVTRFAPTDMLLQRLGRLWRHTDAPRVEQSVCEAWLLAPALAEAIESPQASFGGTAAVYAPYVLCRSLEVWKNRNQISLPNDIRGVIEATYKDRQEDGQMSRWLHELREGTRWRTGQNALNQLANLALSSGGTTLPEHKAQTRYSEADAIEVLLIRAIRIDATEKTTHLTLLDGSILELPWKKHQLKKQQWREVAAELNRQLVYVRDSDAPKPVSSDLLQKHGFGNCFYLGDPQFEEVLLRVAIVDESGYLKGLYGDTVSDRKRLAYRDDLGYQTTKIKGDKA